MSKFFRVLTLVFTLAFGYGLGQHTQDLFATDYPTGGAGGGTHPVNLASDVTGELPHSSTSDDVAQVHGLGASVNVMGNRDASGQFLQSDNTADITTATTDLGVYEQNTAVTFAVAFSATPAIVTGVGSGADPSWTGGRSSTTTGFTFSVFGVAASTAHSNLSWAAIGS